MIKPHDIALALKYGTLALCPPEQQHAPGLRMGKPVSSRWLGDELGLSQSEVVKANVRLQASKLISQNNQIIPNFAINTPFHLVTRNMTEWLCYGIRYYLPPEKAGIVRGMATGWSCEYLDSEVVPPDIPLVWKKQFGDISGEGIEPLYKNAALAASKDIKLYSLLALIDIMRTGRPRELNIAIKIINNIMEDINNAQLQL